MKTYLHGVTARGESVTEESDEADITCAAVQLNGDGTTLINLGRPVALLFASPDDAREALEGEDSYELVTLAAVTAGEYAALRAGR